MNLSEFISKRFDEWKAKTAQERVVDAEATSQFLKIRESFASKTLLATSKLDQDIFPDGQWFRNLENNWRVILPLSQEVESVDSEVVKTKMRKSLLQKLGFLDNKGHFVEAGIDLLKVQEEREVNGAKARVFFTQSPIVPNVILSYSVREYKGAEGKVMFFVASEFLEYTKNPQGYADKLKRDYVPQKPAAKAQYL